MPSQRANDKNQPPDTMNERPHDGAPVAERDGTASRQADGRQRSGHAGEPRRTSGRRRRRRRRSDGGREGGGESQTLTPVEIAARRLGITRLHPEQDRVISDVLRGRDLLVVLPTGFGKSACYQVPSMIFPRPVVLISPL